MDVPSVIRRPISVFLVRFLFETAEDPVVPIAFLWRGGNQNPIGTTSGDSGEFTTLLSVDTLFRPIEYTSISILGMTGC